MATGGEPVGKSVLGRVLSVVGGKVDDVFSAFFGTESRAEEQARVHKEFIDWIEKREYIAGVGGRLKAR
jgi:hypothetical protein